MLHRSRDQLEKPHISRSICGSGWNIRFRSFTGCLVGIESYSGQEKLFYSMSLIKLQLRLIFRG